jgi:C-terminal processing protease CtpA/Prc
MAKVLSGTPPQAAGLAANDRILAVDGHPATASPDAVPRAIRGRPGTSVAPMARQHRVRRTVVPRRATVQVPTWFARMLPGNVGSLR